MDLSYVKVKLVKIPLQPGQIVMQKEKKKKDNSKIIELALLAKQRAENAGTVKDGIKIKIRNPAGKKLLSVTPVKRNDAQNMESEVVKRSDDQMGKESKPENPTFSLEIPRLLSCLACRSTHPRVCDECNYIQDW